MLTTKRGAYNSFDVDKEEKKAVGLVKVKAQRRFLDKELNQIKDTGDVYTVSRERAAVLKEAGVVEVAE